MSAAPTPMVIAPVTWLRAAFGLRMRPAAQTASMRRTRISAVAASTATSAKCAPKVDCWYFSPRSPNSILSSASMPLAPAASASGTLRLPERTIPPANVASAELRPRGRRIALGPAETLGAEPQAFGEMTLRERPLRMFGIDRGVVENAKFDWIELELLGHFVDGDFERHQARRFSGCAHSVAFRQIENRKPHCRHAVGAG